MARRVQHGGWDQGGTLVVAPCYLATLLPFQIGIAGCEAKLCQRKYAIVSRAIFACRPPRQSPIAVNSTLAALILAMSPAS